ncbi:MAG: 16S rRNA (cytidine(1402)-2'-O)-methyltransferase [Chitinivibrionales bacterium]|nr:16S rRNA (cytidine(1402)-2'-O)-methyltransferase [Chitinivibrionales bacterium]
MGALYIVATPIGNLGDISARAAAVLGAADYILAEDSRVSINLLKHLGITKHLVAFHDFNKEKTTPGILADLQAGKSIALISDAGTPGIADEAFYLVRAALAADIRVIPVPGACALVCALVASGLPTDRFIFENFLENKSGRRRRFFTSALGERRTIIFYESPFRIVKVLAEMQETLGDVLVVIGREMTKMHEEFLRGSPAQLIGHFKAKPPKGEMVVLFNTRVRAGA